jgi:hypothetical protein
MLERRVEEIYKILALVFAWIFTQQPELNRFLLIHDLYISRSPLILLNRTQSANNPASTTSVSKYLDKPLCNRYICRQKDRDRDRELPMDR